MSTGAKDLDVPFSWRGEAGRSTSNVFRTPTLSSMDVGGRLQRAFPSAPQPSTIERWVTAQCSGGLVGRSTDRVRSENLWNGWRTAFWQRLPSTRLRS